MDKFNKTIWQKTHIYATYKSIYLYKYMKASGSPTYYLTLYFLMIIAEIPACDAATLIQRK